MLAVGCWLLAAAAAAAVAAVAAPAVHFRCSASYTANPANRCEEEPGSSNLLLHYRLHLITRSLELEFTPDLKRPTPATTGDPSNFD